MKMRLVREMAWMLLAAAFIICAGTGALTILFGMPEDVMVQCDREHAGDNPWQYIGEGEVTVHEDGSIEIVRDRHSGGPYRADLYKDGRGGLWLDTYGEEPPEQEVPDNSQTVQATPGPTDV